MKKYFTRTREAIRTLRGCLSSAVRTSEDHTHRNDEE